MSVGLSYHQLLKHMIDWGADINKTFEDDCLGPLEAARQINNKETIEILLQNGAHEEIGDAPMKTGQPSS